ncbi:endonuclease domain-containing protein [Maribacter chungangensis]|uniref:Endonuclease domain-containing protein n=1 Tax=Maribacter chungangensis TaxID=1069117 RepID=A0ABW3B550_9FLAO
MKKQNNRVHTKQELSERRRELRQRMTPSEAFLWNHLKSRNLDGKRFTRQHSIGNYIVDFYCASERLIIELDGEVHQNPSAVVYDTKRTSYFEEMNYNVVRFENKMVFDNLSSVIMEIRDNFKSKTK